MYVCYSNLPAKPADEAQKHRQQYEEMVAQAKKRGEVIWQSHQGSHCLPTEHSDAESGIISGALESTTATNKDISVIFKAE